MEIKASQVKELRDMTGVAMMDCKKALVECEGDIEKALDLLRSNSALKAEKKSSRVAADGILVASVNEDYATLVELNSETDFAAKDANFLSFGEKVKEYISKNKIIVVHQEKNKEQMTWECNPYWTKVHLHINNPKLKNYLTFFHCLS